MEDEMQIMLQSTVGFDIREQLHSVYLRTNNLNQLRHHKLVLYY